MVTLLILALVFAGLALALAARAVVLPRLRAEESLGQIAAYGYRQSTAAEAEDEPVLPNLAGRLGALVGGRDAERREAETRKLLLASGAWGITPASFIGYRALAAIVLGLSVALLMAAAGTGALWVILAAGYATVAGWVLPLFILKSRARDRAERIEIELPELIDLLVVTLEAGLGFAAALQRSAERTRGPLVDEMKLTLHEHTLGLTIEQALRNFLDRVDAPAVRSFVRAIAQSETLGVSIADVMRELAGDMRIRRRQIIQEKAQKAPIKILFPLAFLIMPAMFIVVLFPGLYSILDTLGG